MTPAEWRRIKEIAAGALDQAESSRAAYLAARCEDDPLLRGEVDSLIASATHAEQLFERPTLLVAGASAALETLNGFEAARIGERIGPYRIVRELGRGGMGAAYLGVRADDAFEKRVAIKLIKRGMDTDAILHRFRRERQILANLEHPNIVMLLDGGTTDDDRPYFIMEYVDGLPIDTYCDTNALTIPDRLKLFQAVCAAVHHAHQQRVVHRDLKPSNILVTAGGVPKLLDFGIAKLLDAEHDSQTIEPMARAMTPQYASPEQIRGEPLTPSSDIYSLGVLLYQLLTGRQPYQLDGHSPREAERMVCEDTPPRPAALILDAARRRADAGERVRVRRVSDLGSVVLTALHKEPERRYSSARALADDLQRYLDGQLVEARPARLAERLFAIVAPARLSHGGTRALIAGVALAGMMLLGLFTFLDGRRPPSTGVTPPRSIAVMPLSNSGGSPDLEYLSDGITEDVIYRLSRATQLKVIARDSAYRYKGRVVDPQQIGRELGVDAVLTGRVVQRGTMLSVVAELVDARDRRQLWGERYDRPIADVDVLQRELAERIAMGLRLQFTGDERARFARQYTHDPDAYQLYLKGRYFWNKRTVSGFHTSASHFQDAVDRDPAFALAYVGLADSYALLTEYHGVPAVETYGKAKAAVTRALEIDPFLAEAHTTLAYIRQFYEWDRPGAEQEYRRAIDLNPNYATGYQWFAEYLSSTGRHVEALDEIRKAQTVDPLSLIVNAVEANLLYMAGDYDGSIAKSRQVIEMDPNFPEVYEYLKRAYDQKGHYADAIAARQMRRRLIGLDISETPALRDAAAATSARTYWRHRLSQEIKESEKEGVLAFEFAEILTQAGDVSAALDWLERACRDHDFMMTYLSVAPNLAALRGERRYQELVRGGCRVDGPRR